MQPTLIMLIGLPGTGKSTWVNDHLIKYPKEKFGIISTDDIIQAFAKQNGFSYNEFFSNMSYNCAERISHHTGKLLFDNRRNVIWDQTNLTKKSRARKLAMAPRDYYRTAVVFEPSSDHLARLEKRAQLEGKHIPLDVITSMSKKFEAPDFTEEFDAITYWTAQTTQLRETPRYVP